MKKLQQNFTTPEQSKRLLELGLPADSADCYHNRIAEKPYILSMPYSYCNWDDKDNPPLPCWSVGRLIEIFEICTPYVFTGFYNYIGTNIEVMIKIYESVICHPVENLIDFSKLEE